MKFKVLIAFMREGNNEKEVRQALADLGEFLVDKLNCKTFAMKIEEDKNG